MLNSIPVVSLCSQSPASIGGCKQQALARVNQQDNLRHTPELPEGARHAAVLRGQETKSPASPRNRDDIKSQTAPQSKIKRVGGDPT